MLIRLNVEPPPLHIALCCVFVVRVRKKSNSGLIEGTTEMMKQAVPTTSGSESSVFRVPMMD